MEKHKYLIFIYDNCLRGLSNHHLLQNAHFYKEDIIPKYNLMLLNDIPMATPNKNVWNMSSKLFVETYYIDDTILKELDEHYRVPDYFQRTNVKSRSGKWGVLYYVKEKKSKFKGNGKIITQKWDDYLQKVEKYDNIKKKRKIENEIIEEQNRKDEEKRIKKLKERSEKL